MKKLLLFLMLALDCQITYATEYKFHLSIMGGGRVFFDNQFYDQGTDYTIKREEGTYTYKLYPDNGFIVSVKVNGINVNEDSELILDNGGKVSLYKNWDTASILEVDFHSDISISVSFDLDPEYLSLNIESYGNGSVFCRGNIIRNNSMVIPVLPGTIATIEFRPDNRYKIDKISVNGSNVSVTSSLTLTINSHTPIKVWFSTKPSVIYNLTISAKGCGEVSYNGTTVRNETKSLAITEGDSPMISFSPDIGYYAKNVKLNGTDVSPSNNTYLISNVASENTLEVEFDELEKEFTKEGILYEVLSFSNNSVIIGDGNYGLSINVPATVVNQGIEWNVVGLSDEVMKNNTDLAVIMWNPENNINVTTRNPNLLLYVKDVKYAPTNIHNVVVGDVAESIILAESQSNNNFYCPKAFMAKKIAYSHRYRMRTGGGESRGWETIALPFDVQKIEHVEEGEILPFAKWSSTSTEKPFWLYMLSASGFVEANGIKANTPYVISMPNNDVYQDNYKLRGTVTFSSTNVEVKKSDDIVKTTYGNRTLIPNFINLDNKAGYYALNVNNDMESYQGQENEGSVFIQNLRRIHPFEAYMTSTSGTRAIGVFDGMTTAIKGIEDIEKGLHILKVYNLNGQCIKTGTSMESLKHELPAGIYIINNKKIIIK